MPAKPCPEVPHLHVFLNTSRDGDSLGSLFQCLTTLSVKKFFLISNLNLPWQNLRPLPLILSLVIQEKGPNTCLTTASFQVVVVETSKVPPQPLLQTKQPQFPQLFLMRLVLQTPHQPCCSSLDMLQPLNVLLVVRGRKLNTGLKVHPHQCQVQGHDHLPTPAGHAIPDTSQDVFGLLGHLGTLLASCRPTPPGLFPTGSFPATPPQAGSVAWGCCDPSAEPGIWPC